jgi:hypothetical protein
MAEESTFDPNEDIGDLSDLENVWDEGKSHQRDDQPVGLFTVTISNATYGHSQASGRPQIHYEMVIDSGEHKGKILHKYDGLDTAQQASIAQNGLKTLGVDVKALSAKQLPAALISLRGRKITVRTKQNDEFYNIYFQRNVQKLAPGVKTGNKTKKKF